MIRLAILALILAGCGSHGGGSHPAPVVTPPPPAFADVAGPYLATRTFGTGMPYDATPNGTRFDATIVADGTVTVHDHISHAVVATYQLIRMGDGSFTTAARPIIAGLTEFGTAPADLSTFHLRSLKLWAGFTDQGTLYGTEDLSLVPVGTG